MCVQQHLIIWRRLSLKDRYSEPIYEKTNIVDSALSIDPDQPKPDRHFSPPEYFLFESLLYTSIPLRRNLSARISMRGLRRLIWIDTLRKVHNVFVFVWNVSYVAW